MTNVNPENAGYPAGQTPGLDDVIEPEGTALPEPSRRGHAKIPEGLGDDYFAAADQEEREYCSRAPGTSTLHRAMRPAP